MFTLQKYSNYGTSASAVARTALQGCDILHFIACPELKKEDTKTMLLELQRHLVKCVEIRDNIAEEIIKGHAEFTAYSLNVQSGARTMSLPGVGDIQSKAELFLQSAKLAIASTGNLFQPFYGLEYGHNYQKIGSWAEKEFGIDDQFTTVLKSWEPFVKRICTMRNCVDHPKSKLGVSLVTANFTLAQEGVVPELIEPTWGLSSEVLQPMLPSFTTIIEETIRLGENVLVGIFYRFRCNNLVEIEEVPLDQRDPSNPRRLRVKLAK